jgi:hypothetical protein
VRFLANIAAALAMLVYGGSGHVCVKGSGLLDFLIERSFGVPGRYRKR